MHVLPSTEHDSIVVETSPSTQKLIMRLYASSCVAFSALYSCPPSAAARGGGTALPTCLCLLCTLPLKWKWSGKPCGADEQQGGIAVLGLVCEGARYAFLLASLTSV